MVSFMTKFKVSFRKCVPRKISWKKIGLEKKERLIRLSGC